jgi:hypothetical protein
LGLDDAFARVSAARTEQEQGGRAVRQDPAPRRLDAAADDTVPGDISTGESVEVGGSRLGTIDNAGDRDF